jgi:hypothetical protein
MKAGLRVSSSGQFNLLRKIHLDRSTLYDEILLGHPTKYYHHRYEPSLTIVERIERTLERNIIKGIGIRSRIERIECFLLGRDFQI